MPNCHYLCSIFIWLLGVGLVNAATVYVPSPEDMEQKTKWVERQVLVSDDDHKLIDFYWTGMFDGRIKLNSGRLKLRREIDYTEEGRKHRSSKVIESLPHNILYDFYFDYNKNFFFFSRKEKEKRRVFVKNKDVSLYYDGIVTLKNSPVADSPHYQTEPFDARYIGLLYGTRFDSPNKVRVVEDLKNYYKIARVVSVQKMNDEIIQMATFTESKDSSFVSEWLQQIDSSKGFSLGKIQAIEILFRNGQEFKRPSQDISFTYEEFGPQNNRVWLPVKWVELYYSSGKPQHTVTMTLEWSQINELLSDDLFTLEAMNVDDGKFMIDKRLGDNNSIIEGQIEGGKVQLRGEAALLAALEEANSAAGKRSFRIRMACMAIGMTLILYALYRLYRDGRKRKGDQGQ